MRRAQKTRISFRLKGDTNQFQKTRKAFIAVVRIPRNIHSEGSPQRVWDHPFMRIDIRGENFYVVSSFHQP
ncbi:MAG TPA: hypothetical protein DCP63_07330 [Bacteroidetes bacterium]|nr:hypothetical protein [Bacteroidota bacterium]